MFTVSHTCFGIAAVILFLLSGRTHRLSGCTHRCCDRDNRYRGQSDHHFAYHGAHSVSGYAPQPLHMKLNSSDTVARVRQYRAVAPTLPSPACGGG